MDPMLKYWWQKHAEQITQDDLYSWFEKAWEDSQHYLLLSMREWNPSQVGKAIADARLREAIEDKDASYVEIELSFLDYYKSRLERAKQKIVENDIR